MIQQIVRGASLGAALFLLTACDSAEERAEKHYQAALEYLENGDLARATVEFRNVFKLNDKHKEARLAYAKMHRESGDISKAYSQYLRLVEQYPNNLEGRRALAQMATLDQDWNEVERHIKVAAEQAPQDPIVRAVLTSIAYRDAIAADDKAAILAAAKQGLALTVEAPDLVIPHFIVINERIRGKDWSAALNALDAAITVSPDTRGFYNLRLGVLDRLNRTDEIGWTLEEMVRQFPADDEIQESLVDWYMSHGNLAAVEEFLRKRIDSQEDGTKSRMALLRFLSSSQGPEAAIEEVDKMLAQDLPREPLYQALRAGQLMEAGKPEAAIADLQAFINQSEPSADLNDAKIVLTHMLLATGSPVEAYPLVEEVLTEDPGHVEAIKIQASQLIEEDRAGDAIIILRTALRDSPRDPKIMTLLARAHERDGNRNLMADMMSLAVEASNSAPDEAKSYAEFLASEGQHDLAVSVLNDALTRQPNNIQLLTLLGHFHIHQEDWKRAQSVINTLEALGETGRQPAQVMTANLISARGQNDTLLSYLGEIADGENSRDYVSEIGIVSTHVDNGDLNSAREYLENALEASPSDFMLRFLQASILAGLGEQDQAVALYRALLKERPYSERTWVALYVLLSNTNPEQSTEVLEQAIEALPESTDLRWLQAGLLETEGDIEGAIEVYKSLYAADSNSEIVANNLASLLASYSDDAESLDQAYRIARRLQNSTVPHFNDTYGWIAYRRGDYEAALKHLQFAARQLPEEATVLYHLGVTYAALGRNTEALTTFEQIAGLQMSSDLARQVQDAMAALPTPTQDGN